MHPTVRLLLAARITLGAMARSAYVARRPGGAEQVRSIARGWADELPEAIGVTIRAFGVEHFDPERPCVVMANHQSYLDVLALYRALPRPFGIVAKKELYAIPTFGAVADALGCVKVDRGGRGQAVDAMARAADEVRAGSTIAVFPEGTRSSGDRILPLKKGPFYLAQHAGVPVLPVGIRGSGALMPRSNTRIEAGTIEVHVGPPIPAVAPPDPADARATRAAREDLAARTRIELGRLADLPLVP